MQYQYGLVVKCPNCRGRCTFEFYGRQVQDMQCPECMALFKIVLKGAVWSWNRDGVVRGIQVQLWLKGRMSETQTHYTANAVERHMGVTGY